MTRKEIMTSGPLKVLLPIVIIAFVIAIAREGYAFGQWLHVVLNK